MKTKEMLNLLLEIIRKLINDISLPDKSKYVGYCVTSTIILVVVVLFKFLNLYTFFSWEGATIAFIFNLIILGLERRSKHEILRLYRAAELRVRKVVRGKTRPSKSRNTKRNTNRRKFNKQQAGQRKRWVQNSEGQSD